MPLFNFGSSDASSQSSASSSGRSFVDPSQQPFLDFTRNLGMGSATGQMGQLGGLQAGSQQLFGQGQQFLGNLAQTGGDQRLGAQIGALGTGLGQFFNQQLLPGLGRDAVGASGFGGGRHQVGQGVAAGQVANAFTQGASQLIGQAEQQRLQASIGGLGMMPGTLGLLQQPFGTEQSILANLAGVIGGPTVLSQQQAQSQSSSTAERFNFGFGFEGA